MDSNPWSLLHIVFPLYLCGLRKNIIYVYLEEGRPFYFVLLCRLRVCRYIFGRLRFLYFVVSSTSWNYELQWKMYMWIDISCECWHEFHGISSNISYIVWTLKWISLEFRMIAGMNFPGEFRRNFFSLLYVGWALTWISLELSYVTAAWALVRIYWEILDAHGMQLELWAPELLNIYTCHFDCLYEFYQHYDWWTCLLYCVLCLCIRDRGWLLYVPNVVFIFVDGMRCVYPATNASTLAVCYFIYYRDIKFSVEWREFCTVFLFLYYLRWKCHALENSPTKVANS